MTQCYPLRRNSVCLKLRVETSVKYCNQKSSSRVFVRQTYEFEVVVILLYDKLRNTIYNFSCNPYTGQWPRIIVSSLYFQIFFKNMPPPQLKLYQYDYLRLAYTI